MEALFTHVPFPERLKWILQLHPGHEIEYFDEFWMKARIQKVRLEPIDNDKMVTIIQQTLKWNLYIETANKDFINMKVNAKLKDKIRPVSSTRYIWQCQFTEHKLGTLQQIIGESNHIPSLLKLSEPIYYKQKDTQNKYIIIAHLY